MKRDSNIEVFFALLRAGLWGNEARLSNYGEIDFGEVYQLAEEQSTIGLVAAGLERVSGTKPAKKDVLQFIGRTIQMEQQNQAMNYFIAVLVDKMRKEGIYTLLLKGQGIAQCYERPLWRSCGDVDFFLSDDNYEKAKTYLTPLASDVEPEGEYKKHLGMTISPWVVELHGNLRCGLSARVDKVLDEIKYDVFFRGDVRSWLDGDTQVFLMSVSNDAIYIFTHILGHFYKGGIGVRQICDWSRLLWIHKEDVDLTLIEYRLKKMGLLTEWKAFGAFVVEYLGMPAEAIPLYSPAKKWKRKATLIRSFIVEVGNFGHNRDSSYFEKYPYLIRKMMSFGIRCWDLIRHIRIFPVDSLRFFPSIVFRGVQSAVKGE